MKKVLLAEDDAKLSPILLSSIQGAGINASLVGSWDELTKQIHFGEKYDLLILDRLIGSIDTKDKILEIKGLWPHCSVLVISTINTPNERAELIELGADDYLGKPFITEEFVARIRSLIRRSGEVAPEKRKIGEAILDLVNRTLSKNSIVEALPNKEFLVLSTLSENPGKVLSRADLLRIVWGNVNLAEANLVEATVTNLRKRLSNMDCGFQIKNQRSIGYWIAL